MSEENVEVVRRFCERDDQTSLDSLMASLHPNLQRGEHVSPDKVTVRGSSRTNGWSPCNRRFAPRPMRATSSTCGG
jgi:hypothetical protein